MNIEALFTAEAIDKPPDYSTLWKSGSNRWRIIRCKDDIQFIVQQYKSPKSRIECYHVERISIALIHGDKDAFNLLPYSNLAVSRLRLSILIINP